MNVVITVPWGERLGGAENVLWTFLRHVDRRQVMPTVAFLQPGPFEREVAGLGFQTVVIPVGRLRNFPSLIGGIRELASLLRSKQPSLVINWSAKTQLYGAISASLAGMAQRVIWWQHGLPTGHWMDVLATCLPTRAIGCCSASAKLAQDSHWPRRRTFVVYPGIDRPARASEEERMSLRRRLGIPADTPVIGIVGRLQPWKGQHRVIRALAALQLRGRRVHGLVVGGNAYGLSPGYEASLHQLARDLGIEANVSFTGHVSDTAPYVQLMDVSVNASIGEPFGLTLVEAMALGVPVVAFALGGPSEIIESGRSGFLVAAGDEQALVSRLETIIVDRELRLRIGHSGHERFHELFSGQRMAQQMGHWLHELCPN